MWFFNPSKCYFVGERVWLESEKTWVQVQALPGSRWLLLLLLSHFSRVQLCATPWTAARQAPLSLGFSRQEYWSGLPFPSPVHACMHGLSRFSHVQLCATPWMAAHQAPLSTGFSRQEYWSGLPNHGARSIHPFIHLTSMHWVLAMHQRCSGCRRYSSGGPPLCWGRVYTLRGDQATPYGRVKQGRLEGRSGWQP